MMKRRTHLLQQGVQTKRDARFFLIVTEGQQTEPLWLSWFAHHCMVDKSRVLVEIIDSQGRSAPQHLLRIVDDAAARYQLFATDERWLVFDVDQYENPNKIRHLRAVVREASQKNYRLAISNPSFEVWLLHHHVDPLPAPMDDARAAEQRLREQLGAYNKARLDDALYDRDKVHLAVARAKEAAPEGSPWPERPGTHVWKLVERLLEASRPDRGVL